jgi:hypothetical protein
LEIVPRERKPVIRGGGGGDDDDDADADDVHLAYV